MHLARRSLALVLTIVLTVLVVPAHAADDGPGSDLVSVVGKTVESLVTLKASPVTAPAPADLSTQVAPAQPVVSVTGLSQAAVGTVTKLTSNVTSSLVGSPVSGTLDPVLQPPTGVPAVDVEQNLGDEIRASAPARQSIASGRPSQRATAQFGASVVFGDAIVSRALVAQSNDTASDSFLEVPRTSTLPDGGSPLTLTWLVLAAAFTAAGALVLRRARTSS